MRSQSKQKSKKPVVSCLVAIAALGLAGWFGVHALGGKHPLASVAIPIRAPANLPDTPAEWRGRIDYPALDRQLAALSQRPEMAGLAVAVVEDGKLSFVRTYGVADKSTGARITPQTLFRWASVSKTATGVLAAALATDGAVDLGRPVADLGTSLRLPGGAESHVTLDQLLAQRSGLTKNAYDEKLEEGQRPGGAAREPGHRSAAMRTRHLPYLSECRLRRRERDFGAGRERGLSAMQSSTGFSARSAWSARVTGEDRLTGAKDWAKPHRGAQVRPIKKPIGAFPPLRGSKAISSISRRGCRR